MVGGWSETLNQHQRKVGKAKGGSARSGKSGGGLTKLDAVCRGRARLKEAWRGWRWFVEVGQRLASSVKA